jgi:hypothetical protein
MKTKLTKYKIVKKRNKIYLNAISSFFCTNICSAFRRAHINRNMKQEKKLRASEGKKLHNFSRVRRRKKDDVNTHRETNNVVFFYIRIQRIHKNSKLQHKEKKRILNKSLSLSKFLPRV